MPGAVACPGADDAVICPAFDPSGRRRARTERIEERRISLGRRTKAGTPG